MYPKALLGIRQSPDCGNPVSDKHLQILPPTTLTGSPKNGQFCHIILRGRHGAASLAKGFPDPVAMTTLHSSELSWLAVLCMRCCPATNLQYSVDAFPKRLHRQQTENATLSSLCWQGTLQDIFGTLHLRPAE